MNQPQNHPWKQPDRVCNGCDRTQEQMKKAGVKSYQISSITGLCKSCYSGGITKTGGKYRNRLPKD